MSRRGFALLTVLWLLAVLSIVVGLAFSVARLGVSETTNRAILTRAAWAREACHEILLSRYAADREVRVVDTIDLGRGTWCRAELDDAGVRLDPNTLTAETWRAILGNDSLVDAVLDWRDADDEPRPRGAEGAWYRARGRRLPRNGPLASVGELRWVRGFDAARVSALERVLLVDAAPQVDLNAAPPAVLLTLPGMTPEAADVIRNARLVGHQLAGPEDLLGRLSPPARTALVEQYPDFMRAVSFGPTRFLEHVVGGVRETKLTSQGWLLVIPSSTRLAVVRRAME